MRVLFAFLFSVSAFGQGHESCRPSLSLEEFRHTVMEVREDYFPELALEQIELVTFKSDAYFMQVKPQVKSLTRQRPQRKYHLELNLKLLACPPSQEAIRAILVHELEHVKDFTQMSSLALARHGVSYLMHFKRRVHYERQTDRKAIEKGHAEGLAQYREWIYAQISAKERRIKEKIYLTPEEIRNL